MASLEELQKAFIAADNKAQKGDSVAKEDAAVFAAEIKRLRQSSSAPAPQQASVAAPSGMQQFANSGPGNTDPNNMASMAARAFMPPQGGAAIDTSPEGQAMKQSAEDAALRFGLPAAGMLAGPYAPAAIPALVGLGTDLAQRLAMKQGRQKDYHYGETIAAPVMAAAFPGAGSMVGKDVAEQAINAIKNGVQVAVGKAVETRIDDGRPITPQELLQAATVGAAGTQFGNAFDTGMSAATTLAKRGGEMMTAAKKAADKLGYVFPPSILDRGTLTTNALEGLADKVAMVKQFRQTNEGATTNAVREHFGLERQDIPGARPEITPATHNTLVLQASKPFEEIAQTSPQAELMLKEYQKLKDQQRLLEKANNSPGNYTTQRLDEIGKTKAMADGWLAKLDTELSAHGKSNLIGDQTKVPVWPPKTLWDARVAHSQLALVKDATNAGSGAVDSSWIGRALNNGQKLTGPLKEIAIVNLAIENRIKDMASSTEAANSILNVIANFGGIPSVLARKATLNPTLQRFMGAGGIGLPQPRADAFSQFMGADARLLGNKIPPINLDQFQNAPGQ